MPPEKQKAIGNNQMTNTMQENLLTQFAVLEQTLVDEKSKTHRSLVILGAAYALLIVWAIWDTSHLFGQIKSISAPEQVAALAAGQLRRQMQHNMSDQFARMAPQVAERVALTLHQAIPRAGETIRQQLNAAADQLAADMAQREVPKLTALLKDKLKDSATVLHYASDTELNHHLVKETVAAFDRELDQVINASQFGALLGVSQDLNLLADKPDSKMSARERAEKAAVLNALRISELARSGDNRSSPLGQGLRAMFGNVLPNAAF
jgi:hypothetical protein